MQKSKLIEIKDNDSFSIDSLYLEIEIIKKLLDFERVKLFFKNNEEKIGNNLKGYLYLLETSLCRIVKHQENLVRDERIYHLLHYQTYNIKDIKKGIKNNVEIDFMEKTLKLRNKLAKIRLKNDTFNENIFEKIENNLENLSKYYFKNHVKEKIENNLSLLTDKLILYLTTNHLDFSGSTDINPKTKEFTFSLVMPHNIYCVSLNDSENISYSFQSPAIKNHEEEYFRGYSLSLSFLLSNFNLDKKYLNSIYMAKEWEDLRMLGHKIYREKYKDDYLLLYNYPLFIPKTDLIFEPISKKNINNLNDFKIILKDRDVQILSYNSDEQKISLFLSLFHGRIELDDKVQIIRFKSKREKGWYNTSYLFYIPFGDLGFYNDSHWLFFYNMGLENNEGYKSKFIYFFERIMRDYNDCLELESYNIEDKLLLKGIKNNYNRRRFMEGGDNIHYIFNENEMVKLSDSKALLLELFTNYLFREKAIYSDVGILVKKEHGKDATDIDCLIITSDKIHIIQVTSFLENKKKIGGLKEHFEKIESRLHSLPNLEKYNLSEKNIERNVFCLEMNNKSSTKKYLKSHNIKVIKYDDIKDALDKEMRKRISKIFDLNYLN